ncbi:uncharacterized protein LOC143426389 [Xylocopa sonorina]|uniref:uncharacterized protein LOC143426389 n=1 Tax=Xylocopa sonorina TaxID=1818115 RepID=UPI00403AA19C
MPFSEITYETLWNKIVRGKMLEYHDKKFHEIRVVGIYASICTHAVKSESQLFRPEYRRFLLSTNLFSTSSRIISLIKCHHKYDLIKGTAPRTNSRGITLCHPIPGEYIISRSLPERSLGVPPCLEG